MSLASCRGSPVARILGERLSHDKQLNGTALKPFKRIGLLRPPPSAWVRSRWPDEAQHIELAWTAALAEARKELLTEYREAWPPRFAGGVTSLAVLEKRRSQHPCGNPALELLESDLYRYNRRMPDRAKLFELKNILQEIGLSELLIQACDDYKDHIRRTSPPTNSDDPHMCRIASVVDVGGGNGYLAFQIKVQLGGHVEATVVDPFPPRHRIDSPDRPRDAAEGDPRLPGTTINRISQKAHTVDWEATIGNAVMQRTTSTSARWNHQVALISKHLCGTSIDHCLRWLELHQQLPAVMVLSPCCYNKGQMEQYLNQKYLAEVGVTTNEGWNRTTKLTDWNASSLRQERERKPKDLYYLEGEWNYLTSDVVHAALDEGRLRWLRQRGYDAQMVCFTPQMVTPKNVAIVAVFKGSRMLLST